jgi:ABC-type sugar transport system ATPase subunit
MQLVAIARALGMKARLIIMDEPTSSLTESGAETLFGLIAQLKRKGVSILYVSHKMDEIFRLSDSISVLRDGALISTKRADETSIQEVIAAMVGRELTETKRAAECAAGDVLLKVRELSSRKLRDISFELRAGEVLGVAGLVGSGRSSLGAALFGLDPSSRGSIEIRGEAFAPQSPARTMRRGIGLVPEDRRTQGLMPHMTVKENATVSILERLQRFRFIRGDEERRLAGEIHRTLLVKAPSDDALVSTLSGGNQQKVLLGRWLLVNPDIFFLDDPTRGIDIGAKHDIYAVINRLASSGKGVIFVSSELPELLRCSDRVMVLHEGRNMGILDVAEATQERIMALATHAPG